MAATAKQMTVAAAFGEWKKGTSRKELKPLTGISAAQLQRDFLKLAGGKAAFEKLREARREAKQTKEGAK